MKIANGSQSKHVRSLGCSAVCSDKLLQEWPVQGSITPSREFPVPFPRQRRPLGSAPPHAEQAFKH